MSADEQRPRSNPPPRPPRRRARPRSLRPHTAVAATAAPPPGGEGTLTVAASASFATTSIGASSIRQISLKNESAAGVDVDQVDFEGVDAGDFGIEGNNCLGFIGPAMDCTLTVRFTPTAGGLREARLRVVTDGTPAEYLTELSGEGASPELTFEPEGPRLRPGRSPLQQPADQFHRAQQRRRLGADGQPRNLWSRRERILHPEQQLLGDDARTRRPARSKSSSTPTKKAASRPRS